MDSARLMLLLDRMGRDRCTAEALAMRLGSRWNVREVRKWLGVARSLGLVDYEPRKVRVVGPILCRAGWWRRKN